MNRELFNRYLRHLQSFSINKCDLSTMVGNVNFFLRTITVNIDKRNTKPIPVIFYIVTIIFMICYYYVYVVSVAWYVFVYYPATGDLVGTAIMFSLGAFTEMCPIKLLFMIINRKLIANVVERYLKCDAEIDRGSRLYHNIHSHLRIIKKRGTITWLSLLLIANIRCFIPFFLPGRHLPDDKYILYGLEPMFESPNYEIASVILTIAILSPTYIVSNCNAFIVMLFGYTEAQILSLSEELVNVWNDAEKETEHVDTASRSSAINNIISERLKYIIKLHIENVTLLKQVESVLRVSLALEFLFLMAGLISAMLAGIEHTYVEVPFAFTQIFMNCYLGQKIINTSETFERAVYDCKWELFNKANMKTVLIILQNSQKTLRLSAGGVAILSYECLMTIIKSCYSFYTTLQSTLKH